MENVYKRLVLRLLHGPAGTNALRSLLDGLTICTSVALAFFLRFSFGIPRTQYIHVMGGMAIALAIKWPVTLISPPFRARWHSFGFRDLVQLSATELLCSFGFILSALLVFGRAFPRSVYVLDYLLCVAIGTFLRAAVRYVDENGRRRRTNPSKTELVIIYGAGMAGQSLVREFQQNPEIPYKAIGFVDDDVMKHGRRIMGLPVIGSGMELAARMKRAGGAKHIEADRVLVAIPSATGQRKATILQRAQESGLPCRLVPGYSRLLGQNGLINQIRDVELSDLLGREPVELNGSGTGMFRDGLAVLVTGAAGSIGSELCRQIAACSPGHLVAVDISETGLFHLERELRRKWSDLNLTVRIGNVRSQLRMAEIFKESQPSTVFHAAAYKHVPLMEGHPVEAIANNVLATANLVRIAADYGTRRFVLISTDKAVRPANVMGATKRLAEMVVSSRTSSVTKFMVVRFGNVLGSNGSVVPLFQEQIAAGVPVTVTHPEMRRFFMTIPEASQLVIQAAAIGRGGEIFVLDMGDQVKVVELARNLIRLSGLRPDVDIPITFVGVRPGEKLSEELRATEEDIVPTPQARIMVLKTCPPSAEMIDEMLANARRVVDLGSRAEAINFLKARVPEYSPVPMSALECVPLGPPSGEHHNTKVGVRVSLQPDALS